MIDATTALTSEGFAEVQAEFLRSQIEVRPARSFSASLVGHPCPRYIAWSFFKHSQKERHSEALQSIFDQGHDLQPIIYRKLDALGFEIVRESDRTVDYKWKGVRITGRSDGRIIAFRGAPIRPSKVLEVKTLQGHTWSRLETVADLRDSKLPYLRSYYAQGNVYCFLENLDGGVFVLHNKSNGLLKLLPFELDLENAEGILQRVEYLQPFVEKELDPPPITFDWNVCGRCGFLSSCYPKVDFGKGAQVIESQDFIELLERRERLGPAKREYERVDKGVKEQLEHMGIENAVAGEFIIEGVRRHRKAYSVKENDYVQFSIERMTKPTDG